MQQSQAIPQPPGPSQQMVPAEGGTLPHIAQQTEQVTHHPGPSGEGPQVEPEIGGLEAQPRRESLVDDDVEENAVDDEMAEEDVAEEEPEEQHTEEKKDSEPSELPVELPPSPMIRGEDDTEEEDDLSYTREPPTLQAEVQGDVESAASNIPSGDQEFQPVAEASASPVPIQDHSSEAVPQPLVPMAKPILVTGAPFFGGTSDADHAPPPVLLPIGPKVYVPFGWKRIVLSDSVIYYR